jgi:hypothetical protein
MPICKEVDPVMAETEPGHITRCHLFEQPEGTSTNLDPPEPGYEQ